MGRPTATLAIALILLAAFAATPPVSAQPADGRAEALAGGSAASLMEMPERGSLTVRGAFYVPAYARLSLARGSYPIDLAVTLYVHNASDAKPLVVERIAYRDTAGALVQEYLTAPVAGSVAANANVAAPIDAAVVPTAGRFPCERILPSRTRRSCLRRASA